MVLKTTLATGLIALSTAFASATPATAGLPDLTVNVRASAPSTIWYGQLAPYQVRNQLRRQGYRELDFLEVRGHVYSVKALDPRHGRVVIKVNARNGKIVSWERVGRNHRFS